LETYPFFVYERPGFKVAPLMLNKNITVLKAPLLEISSTQIREMIQQKKSIRYLVPDIVREEIESHLYYK
jgi:nicotinate-nucleotide adenylyltransferase